MSRVFGIAALAVSASIGHLHAQSLEGDVALSFGNAPFLSTDDDDERLSETGYKASGWIGTRFGDWRVFADINHYQRSIGDEDFDEYAPEGATSYGLHFGRSFGPAYVGGFIGRNRFQSDDAGDGNGYLSGDLYGLEGQYEVGAMSVFGQFGKADMVGDPGDVAFVGNFVRIGISATIDKLTMTADFEKGHSPDIFEDGGDYGDYRALGVVVDYQITDRIIATASYETMDIIANTEDSGFDDFYSLGIRIPLGTVSGKRNNLTTSYRPGLAAAWASTLD